MLIYRYHLIAPLVVLSRRSLCRSRPRFFGLTDEYIESVYEEFFLLKYHGGWSFTEAYSLPIVVRRWFLKRLAEQLEKEKEAIESKSSGRGNSRRYEVGEGPPQGPRVEPRG